MEIAELLWLDAVVDKIESKHRVTPTEVEEILSNRPRIRKMNRGHFRGEDVYRSFGTDQRLKVFQSCGSHARYRGRTHSD